MHSTGNCKILPLLCRRSSLRKQTKKKKEPKGLPVQHSSSLTRPEMVSAHPRCFFPGWITPSAPRVPVLPGVLTPENPEEPRVPGEGTPLPPLVISLPVARLFLLTLIKEDLGELFVKGSHSLQLKAKKTTQAYH